MVCFHPIKIPIQSIFSLIIDSYIPTIIFFYLIDGKIWSYWLTLIQLTSTYLSESTCVLATQPHCDSYQDKIDVCKSARIQCKKSCLHDLSINVS